MYSETIEHLALDPGPDQEAPGPCTSGKDMGRLYEIVPEGFAKLRFARLSKATIPERVALLADPDAWWRETAQRLLIESRDPSAIPLLKAMARDSFERPRARPCSLDPGRIWCD